MLKAEAAEHQRQKEAAAQERRQIQMMQLGLLAVNAGVTSIWEVAMSPGPGMSGRSMSVLVPARNSSAAAAQASQKYPGYLVTGARQYSRR